MNNISFKSYVRTKTVYKINQECIKKKKNKTKKNENVLFIPVKNIFRGIPPFHGKFSYWIKNDEV